MPKDKRKQEREYVAEPHVQSHAVSSRLALFEGLGEGEEVGVCSHELNGAGEWWKLVLQGTMTDIMP